MSHLEGDIPTDHFEVDQYVRVLLTGDRTEIGVVAALDAAARTVTVTTRHGYDITVPDRNVRRAFLVVLDLNGVLVARGRGVFVHRPHVAEFIRFVFKHFVVAVWTSGLERTSNPIIDSVLDGYQDRLLFTLYRDSCTERPTPESPYGTVKDLQRIFDRYPASFHSVNTIIIDDSPDKCSHPDIALCPAPYKDAVAQAGDDGLKRVIDVLQEVLDTDSLLPLIRTAQERLAALRGDKEAGGAHEAGGGTAAGLTQVELWKTRLCCDNLCGSCVRGPICRFSHDADDGRRPCSSKDHCRRGHAARWIAVKASESERADEDETRAFHIGGGGHHQKRGKGTERPKGRGQGHEALGAASQAKSRSRTTHDDGKDLRSERRDVQDLWDMPVPSFTTAPVANTHTFANGDPLVQRGVPQYGYAAGSSNRDGGDTLLDVESSAARGGYGAPSRSSNSVPDGNNFYSLEDLKQFMSNSSSHTGIPKLDAELQKQRQAQVQSNQEAQQRPKQQHGYYQGESASVHLANDPLDGTALLRQLQTMARK